MNRVPDVRSARALAQNILRSMERIAQLSKANPGLVREAVDAAGDRIAFWNDGARREFNLSLAERQLSDIGKAFPDALRSRSGASLSPIRIELPLMP